MNLAIPVIDCADPAATLERHAVRRSSGTPTVSVLIGPLGAGGRAWRRWAATQARPVVVTTGKTFPGAEWVHAAARSLVPPPHEQGAAVKRPGSLFSGRDAASAMAPVPERQAPAPAGWRTSGDPTTWLAGDARSSEKAVTTSEINLPDLAIERLAQRARRDPAEFRAAWQAKGPLDRQRFWSTLAPSADDELLRILADSAVDCRSSDRVAVLVSLGERAIAGIVHLAPSTSPGILFMTDSTDALRSVAEIAASWAIRVPALPIAVAVAASDWGEFLAAAPESRTKALLREGEAPIPILDTATAVRILGEAGAGSAATALAADGVDTALLESALAAARATALEPQSEADQICARSAAERFLFEFLESLPETAGRFELNGVLEFRFGARRAEVDLLCRAPPLAIELDGYFHFQGPGAYRRDRAKDWELQRHGFVVLRFLAEDVIPQLETIRDRILEALAATTAPVYAEGVVQRSPGLPDPCRATLGALSPGQQP